MNGAKYPRLCPPKGSIYSLHDCKSFFLGKDSVDIFEKDEILFKNTIVWCIFELDGITKAEARFCV